MGLKETDLPFQERWISLCQYILTSHCFPVPMLQPPASPNLKIRSQRVALTASLPGRLQRLGCMYRRYPCSLVSHPSFSPLCDSSAHSHVSIRGDTSPATHQMLRCWCTLSSGEHSPSLQFGSSQPDPARCSSAKQQPGAAQTRLHPGPPPRRGPWRDDFRQLREKEKCPVRGSRAVLTSGEEDVCAVRSWHVAFHGWPSVVLPSYI